MEILLHIDTEQQVACITLNRPEKFNSFNRTMALSLQEQLQHCAEHPDVRAIVLTGAGKAFCAGQDLAEAIDPHGPGINRIVSEHYNPLIMLLRTIEKPIIAAVNGVAAGAGANIALACDLCLAADTASFIQAFSKIGLIPDSGGTFTLPRLVGLQRATALMMLGERVSATDAAAMGMIYKVVNEEVLMSEAMRLAYTLSKMPTKALGLTKRALNASLAHTLEAQLALEDELQTQAGQSYDYQEGVQAFLQKRKPVFKGR